MCSLRVVAIDFIFLSTDTCQLDPRCVTYPPVAANTLNCFFVVESFNYAYRRREICLSEN
jgi:hypothetical protein